MSRKDLNFKKFETMLKKEKEKIEKNLKIIKDEVNTIAREDEIDDTVDMAELQIENKIDQTILHKLEAEILNINDALKRIKSGTYGICEKTGMPIPVERLLANPSARTIEDE
ncbi:TraR/DksA C4-type zinc finger protein [Sulfurimonas autotrophica]|uniref:Transcriptional regulator, TraR/DksA family n=1 Tax=Sulfurimonas autotrophica (strain ATCC BAA-671 / DSM 16294 / JCM 11897 / OK10) TaxID=563040 RepID=E0USZ9_SULAO|nr:TraR/DksA C4-type zinc finger protein [Sulfurimonas autotrophica]ADN09240.1 transcriptional regulator, TraR/DksA family [Sulfurimonas autotrophica DSM 16294]